MSQFGPLVLISLPPSSHQGHSSCSRGKFFFCLFKYNIVVVFPEKVVDVGEVLKNYVVLIRPSSFLMAAEQRREQRNISSNERSSLKHHVSCQELMRQVQGHDLCTDIVIMGRPQILLKVLFKVPLHIVSNNFVTMFPGFMLV